MLTTREHLAGMATQGILANSNTLVSLAQLNGGRGMKMPVAQYAVELADALTAELERSSPSNT